MTVWLTWWCRGHNDWDDDDDVVAMMVRKPIRPYLGGFPTKLPFIIIKSRKFGVLKHLDMTIDIFLNYEMVILCGIQDANKCTVLGVFEATELNQYGNIMIAFWWISKWCSLAQNQSQKLLHVRYLIHVSSHRSFAKRSQWEVFDSAVLQSRGLEGSGTENVSTWLLEGCGCRP